MGIDTSQLQAMISGATPVPSTESYSDTVGGAPDDATTQFDFAEPLAAPPGSYDVLDTWFPAYNGGKIYYRRGYYDGTTGFGDAKIRLKHNLNKRIVKGVTQHPVSKPEFISGYKWNYDGLVILVKCNSLGCWVADARQVKAVVDFRSLGNGTTMGAVNAFCVQTGNWCPDWVKNAIISS